ncbi:MAG: hypothetical protein IH618_04875 [Ignavibacteriaceae bacterium]|nr:hypothetical protein [Ignavibacteriaceae bacterium]
MNKIRDWLNHNKIFFETIAAFLLSSMAVIISFYQVKIGDEQTKLLQAQTEYNRRQIEITEKKEKVEKTAKWGELRNSMWAIMDLYPDNGVSGLKLLSREQKVDWNRKIRTLLDSQIINPVLIENKMCLGYWRNAISRTKSLESLINSNIDEEFIINDMGGILNDISYVWRELVLDSDEISPTGGKPELEDSLNK